MCENVLTSYVQKINSDTVTFIKLNNEFQKYNFLP